MVVVRVTPDLAKEVRISKKQSVAGNALDHKDEKLVKIFSRNIIFSKYETSVDGNNWM